MKQINNYIQEKLKLNKSVIDKYQYTLFPKTREELIEMIHDEMKENGIECNLNHINTSEITDMSLLFSGYFDLNNFNGDISEWDVSNVKDMEYMFSGSHFNSDISNWNVSNVESMKGMFSGSHFNGDISEWDVSNVKDMEYMFFKSNFNGDISEWDVLSVKNMEYMFRESKFNQNISFWKINPDCKITDVFYKCPIKNKFKPKSLQG